MNVSNTCLAAICCIFLSGCATRYQQLELQMKAYRENQNKVMATRDVRAMAENFAREDPEFERIYTERVNDHLAKRTLKYPKLKKHVWPDYPLDLRRNLREAYIQFALIIDTEGKILNPRHLPIEELPVSELFVDAARLALKQWEYEPGTVDGIQREFAFTIPIIFRLQD